jgi:hypothetical protein
MLSTDPRGTRMKTPSLTAGLVLAALSVPVVAAAQPQARGADHPQASQRVQRASSGLTLDVRALPAGRATLAQIADYYYGAPQMSFVLQAANPWLLGVRPNRRLAAVAGHSTIRIPVLRGARPLGPSSTPRSEAPA